MSNLKELNEVSKIALVLLVAIIGYFIMFLIMNSIVPNQQTPMMRMMQGTRMMSFASIDAALINLFSLIAAIFLGFLFSLYLFKPVQHETIKEISQKIQEKKQAKDEYALLKRILSDDEKKIFNEIKKAREITQDSLRFRLGWSKAKISTILTNLDRAGLIQRERQGKTYKVHLQKQI